MKRYTHGPFRQLGLNDLYHGGHRFHPYGRHDRPWFMIYVLASGSQPHMMAEEVSYSKLRLKYLHT